MRTIVSVMLASKHPMFLWWGPNFTQLFNDGYLPSFGREGGAAALGANGREYWSQIWPIIGDEIEAILAGGPATWHEDHLVPIERNGHVEDVYWTYGYSPVRDDDGSVGGVLVVVQETTSRVQTLAERERLLALTESARVDAEKANRAKADFLAMMSHELRTPLSAISGHADLLEIGAYGELLPDQKKALARIQLSERHLLGIINGILNFARIEAGAVGFEIEEVSLVEVLATCEAILAPRLLEKSLEFNCPIPASQLKVCADREKVHQILLNLLSNAVKFTSAGGSITVGCDRGDDGMIELSVSDSGSGIAPDQMERVFQPFVQVEEGLTRSHDGTGLGLSISRELARGMNGDIVLTSTLGTGSRFTLVLPAA